MNSTAAFSLAHIAAIQRNELDSNSSIVLAETEPRSVRPTQFVRPVSMPRPDAAASPAMRRRMMADTLSGLGMSGDPLVFLVSGNGRSVVTGYALGQGEDQGDLSALLGANHPGLKLATRPAEDLLGSTFSCAGLIMGSPEPALPEAPNDPGPIDRFIAGMISGSEDSDSGGEWLLAVVAERLSWNDITKRLAAALGELRAVADQDRGDQPLAAHYRSLLQSLVDKQLKGRATGLWSVSTTFAANKSECLARGLALAQSVLAGPNSRPDPVRGIRLSSAPVLPAQFTAPPAKNPAEAFWTGAYTSLLHSEELAALVSLPRLERTDFEVRRAPRFKQAVGPSASQSITLGAVLERGQPSGPNYTISLPRLSAHALIAGASGSGKTNTVFHLLIQCAEREIPFLVIEPTKTEYRALLDHPVIGPSLKVFTLGNETVSPLRLNPFEVPLGVPVQTHLDRLKALFNASFTMYAPMPQVLERCLTEIYEDCGYDLSTGVNVRGEGLGAMPDLGALQQKIESVVPSLGYEARITADVSAALRTRIDSLRIGAKGLMLDTAQSLDMNSLLSQPTVIELDALGDDDEKAFLVGLIFSRLAAEMARRGPSGGALRHLTVIEEAHRLFLDVPLVAGSEVGNPKGKAVETFCNILSEIRAYGEGILIVDQIPTRLAQDTIKNTFLKIMHRLPSKDDRETMGSAMAQDADEIRAGAALPVGVALANSGGQDGSFEVSIPVAPLLATEVDRYSSDENVRTRMHIERQTACAGPTMREVQMLLRKGDLAEQTFRLLQSLAVGSGPALDVLLPTLQMVGRFQPPNQTESLTATLRELLRYCLMETASSAGWPLDQTAEASSALLEAYDSVIGDLSSRITPVRKGERFTTAWDVTAEVGTYPYPQCHVVCPNFVCRYRHSARRIAQTDPLHSAWDRALSDSSSEGLWPALAGVAERAVERGLSSGVSMEHRRAFAACFTLHSLDLSADLEQHLRDKVFRNVLAELETKMAQTITSEGNLVRTG